MKKNYLQRCLGLLALFCMGVSLQAAVIYVKSDATGAGDGTSWTDAYTDFTAAYTAASDGDELWVAVGEYNIATQTSLKSVSVYGGFAGTETALTGRAKTTGGKAWEYANTTTLKLGASSGTVNLFNASGAVTYTWDGVTFDGNKSSSKMGRALNITTSGSYAITIANCVFQNFSSGGDGGAFNTRYSTVTISNCLITNNEANKGAAGYFDNAVTISGCEITNNTVSTGLATYQGNSNGGGGGLFLANSGTKSVYNCNISGNTASFGGGVFARTGSNVYNCIIVNNTATASGSGVAFDGRDGTGASIYNCIIANNTSSLTDGAGVVFTSTAANAKTQKLYNSVLYNNTDAGSNVVNLGSVVTTGSVTPVINNNILDKEYDSPLAGTNSVISSNAATLFTDVENGNYVPPTGFLGIDAGDATGLTFATGLDYAGANRVQGTSIDIGAYEYTPATQIVSLTSTNVTTNPSEITSVGTGSDLTFTFTVNSGYHAPYVSVNGTKYDPTESDGTYTISIPAVAATQNIVITAFAENVLPVSKDASQRRNGEISGYYSTWIKLGSRGEGAGYNMSPLLNFVPTDAIKAGKYNVAKLRLAFQTIASSNSRTYTVRQVPDTYADIYSVPTDDYTAIINAPIVGTPNQTLALTLNVAQYLDASGDYVLNCPDNINLSVIKSSESNIDYFHSLECGNADYIPVLEFSRDLDLLKTQAQAIIDTYDPELVGSYPSSAISALSTALATDDYETIYDALAAVKVAQIGVDPNAYYRIESTFTFDDGTTKAVLENADGTNIGWSSVDATSVPMLWKLVDNGDGTYRIQSANTGKEIGYTNGTDGVAKLQVTGSGAGYTLNSVDDDDPTVFTLTNSNGTSGTFCLYTGTGFGSTASASSTSGDYVGSYNSTDGSVPTLFVIRKVESVDVTVGDLGASTVILPFATTVPTGVTLYGVTNLESTVAHLTPFAGTTLAANTPVVVEGTSGTYTFPIASESGETVSGNALQGVFAYTVASGLGDNVYVLAANAANTGIAFRLAGSSLQIPNNKAYLTMSGTGANEYIDLITDNVTGIDDANATSTDAKVYYDLSGRKVIGPVSGGIYIVNGQKVLVK